jgi:soluble lytic murein transglycosylase-like protein
MVSHMKHFIFSGLAIVIAFTGKLVMAAETSSSVASPYRLRGISDTYRLLDQTKVLQDLNIPDNLADKPFAELIHAAAKSAGLEPELVHAVISVESAYRQDAKSVKGAVGLMQVLPETAQRYGIRDPAKSARENLKAGTLYLKDLMQMFNGRLELVLAAYNAGENVVLRYGWKIPPYPETQRYVPAVLARYFELRPQPVVTPSDTKIEYIPGTRLNLTP